MFPNAQILGPLLLFHYINDLSNKLNSNAQLFTDDISLFTNVTDKNQKQPPEVFCKKRCSWKFRKIHRKTPVPESLFNKVAGLRPATLLKKRLWHRCFPVNFAKFLRTPFLQNTSGRLLLKNESSNILSNDLLLISKWA